MWNRLTNHAQTLEELMNDYDDVTASFKPNYLPAIERTSDGTIFIQNANKFIVPNTGSEFFMDSYIFLDQSYKPVQEAYGDYTELPKHGYLLKLRLRRPYTMENMEIQYIVNVEQVRIMQSMEDLNNLAMMFASEALPSSILSMEEVYRVIEAQKEFL